jgi:hypothetical protein
VPLAAGFVLSGVLAAAAVAAARFFFSSSFGITAGVVKPMPGSCGSITGARCGGTYATCPAATARLP